MGALVARRAKSAPNGSVPLSPSPEY